MFIVPTAFSIKGAEMLAHTKWIMEETDEDGSSLIAIHPSFNKLLTALRTAMAQEYRLRKTRPHLTMYLMRLVYRYSFTSEQVSNS